MWLEIRNCFCEQLILLHACAQLSAADLQDFILWKIPAPGLGLGTRFLYRQKC